MTPPLSAERVGAAFGLAEVAVTAKPAAGRAGGNPVEGGTWEYRTQADAGFRLAVVVATFPSPRGDTEAVVRGAARFGEPQVQPARWLTGIGDHAALSRSPDGVGVAAAARRDDGIVVVVLHVTLATTPDEAVIELAEEAFVRLWGREPTT